MPKLNPIKKALQSASKNEIKEIEAQTGFNLYQQDIINLMFKGYDPKEYENLPASDKPWDINAAYLSVFRKGKQLNRQECACALNVHEATITRELSVIYGKIIKAGLYPEVYGGGT